MPETKPQRVITAALAIVVGSAFSPAGAVIGAAAVDYIMNKKREPGERK